MRRSGLFAAVIAAIFGFGIVSLTGCGGSGPKGTGGTAPTILSFAANPATINSGQSSSLTGSFTGGTGVITPGNIAATSGTAVPVSPTSTTSYTLTVTSPTGLTATLAATVTVSSPPPSITSFTASPTTITVGSSSSLTATFTGGTGVITPGNISVTSGTPVSVSPTANTTYTLTVSGAGGAMASTTVSVVVVAAPAITSFSASPTSITTGGSANLTGVFTGGTGVITPGNISATSGTPVPVSPTMITTYTLTVTNLANKSVTQSATVTVNPPPSITSFTASPATITVGGSSSLSAVFTGGTGVITPGSISITSGTPVSVSPTTNTTYTLTVTPPTGTPITQNVSVAVVAAPVITSFTANPTSITSGVSSELTGVFTGGTGVITPGNIAATSGTAVSVSPTTTTTYTLTVTNAAATNVTQTATVTVTAAPVTMVTVDPTSPGLAVTNQILGMNLAAWFDEAANATPINAAFDGAGIQSIRWPGGSWSDVYHWGYQTGSSSLVTPYMCTCSSATHCTADSTGYAGNDTFAAFVSAIPLGGSYDLDLALTANYGTNESCTAGGDPNEAAAWVTTAIADGITPSHMTVGNEEYGSWETDLHAKPNDPTTYADAVIGTSGYYNLIKTASPNTLVGIVVDEDDQNGGWDDTTMSIAKGSYDFVEYHFYPETPGQESDTFITQQAAQELSRNIKTVNSELNKWGTAGTPIYVGEIGGPYSNPGKQSVSITQGLYAGQVLGEMMNDGVSRLTWWIGFGNCNGSSGNDSSSLYGWQDFGAYNVFSDGPTNDPGCPQYGAFGTMSPTAEAFNLFQNVAVNGEHVLTPTVTNDTGDNVRAYAATATHLDSTGVALVLVNVNQTTSETVTVTVNGEGASSDVKVITYDKEIYDYTNTNCQSDATCTYDPTHDYSTSVWAPPATTDMGSQSLPLTITLTPWSMNVVLIK
jgi:hypothetical protein